MEFLKVDETNVNGILEVFGKSVDEEGFIIEKKSGKRLKCPYTHKQISSKSFSILPGSATFVNNDIYAIIEHRILHK
jgi:hypothetical protein